MTEQEFVVKATELIKQIVDAIADKEYAKIAAFAQIDSSWIDPGKTQEDGFLEFGEWFNEQLVMWEEYENRSFVVDHFNESCLGKIEMEKDQTLVTYDPTNSGEALDCWFEIRLEVDDNEQMLATFNVNI